VLHCYARKKIALFLFSVEFASENQNKKNSTSYEKSKISQIMPNTGVIKSGICRCAAKWIDAIYALHGKVAYQKFYLARNRKISQN
jgi:hypothetical protein